jgi:transcriptional regulator with XRE-family HTH domain
MSNFDMNHWAKSVGRAIARHRQHCQLTQEAVAESLGIGNEAVSRMERGLVMPSLPRLVELAQLFHCEVTELLTETSPRAADQALHLAQLLDQLDQPDRALILSMVETLVVRMAKR